MAFQELKNPADLPVRQVEMNHDIFPFAESGFLKKEVYVGEGFNLVNYFTRVGLNIPVGEKEWPMIFLLSLSSASSDQFDIAPFHPEEGYTFDLADYDLETRKEKLLKTIADTKNSAISPPGLPLPLLLGINTYAEDLYNAGILRQDEVIYYPRNSAIPLIRSLRVLLNAKGLYEARCSGLDSRNFVVDSLDFHIRPFGCFYPAETGPLPNVNNAGGFTAWMSSHCPMPLLILGEGHLVRFADTEEERSQIGMRFFLDQRALAGKL